MVVICAISARLPKRSVEAEDAAASSSDVSFGAPGYACFQPSFLRASRWSLGSLIFVSIVLSSCCRSAMVGIVAGLLTESFTGHSIPQQIEDYAQILGLLPLDYETYFQ